MPKPTDAGSHPIVRQSVPETVAASLRKRILAGEFTDGEQLRQEAIANAYEVSRMPVREALRQLEAEGLVRLQTHKGAIVTTLSPADVGELFDLRAMLEVDLLHRAVPRMGEHDFAAGEDALARLEAAYRGRDVGGWGDLNWRFHRSLYAAADRPQTLAITLNINNQANRYIRLQLFLTGAFERAEREHRTMLDLCRDGRRDAAVAALRRHILDTKDDLMEAMRRAPAS